MVATKEERLIVPTSRVERRRAVPRDLGIVRNGGRWASIGFITHHFDVTGPNQDRYRGCMYRSRTHPTMTRGDGL